MKKLFFLMACLLASTTMFAAEKLAYELVMITTGDGAVSTSDVSKTIVEGADYVSAVSQSNVYMANSTGTEGVRVGTGSKSGKLTLTLANAIKPTKIVSSIKTYETATFTINGTSFNSIGSKGDVNEYTVTYDGNTEVTDIIFANTASKNRFTITKVAVYHEVADNLPDLTLSLKEIDFGAIGEGDSFTDIVLHLDGANLTTAPLYEVSEGADYFTATGELTEEGGDITISCAETTAGSYAGKLLILADGDIEKELVISARVKAATGTFELYTATTLENGDYVLIGNGTRAMSNTIKSNRIEYATATIANNKIENPDEEIIWTITEVEGVYTIYNKLSAKYAAATGTKNQATLLDEAADAAKWTVSVTENVWDIVNVSNKAGSINANLRNNDDYGFACYGTGTGTAITLYKKKVGGVQTALENVIEEAKAVKVIENGQLVIIKDGVRYSVLGSPL